ncbi:EamA-like transporter family protein [Ekhidna lutea]|uniref:EamA-like transporter family protein n=1 Tax=Ekhidna lutea TaxID=447679 RepID=A0A239FMY8_EKHLU|nr:DMT family transporter [Ekhidna lutea]SNS58207.1 EamA-like transporter family protein [Ekhidna lutea]
MQKSSALAWVLLFILAFIWGSSFILIKKGLIGLEPAEVGSLRILSASLFLLPSALKRFSSIEKSKLPYFVSVGLLGSLVPAFLFAIAQTQLESAITGVLNGLVPIFTILIALIFLKQKQVGTVYIGVIIGFIGTAILITAGEGNSINGINAYALLVVLATICYASNLNLIKRKLNDLHAVTVTSVSLLLVGPIAAIYLFGFTGFYHKISTGTEAIGISTFYISLLGVLGTAIALIIFNKILQMKDALFASSVTYIIPIFAVGWGVLDGERLYLMHYIGMIAVGIGVYIANTNRAAHKK